MRHEPYRIPFSCAPGRLDMISVNTRRIGNPAESNGLVAILETSWKRKLATSDTVGTESLTEDMQPTHFYFTGSNRKVLKAGKKYWIRFKEIYAP